MKKFGDFICKNKVTILVITLILMIPAFIGMELTKINYDILVYLPEDIETVKGQNILADDFNMGAFSVTIIDNMSSRDILKLENKIKEVEGVEKVVSAYDIIGNTIPLEMLPSNVTEKVKNGKSDLMLITYKDSTSAKTTLDAVEEVKEVTGDNIKVGGMSAMVLDTMNLSETEIMIYIVIAVILCILVLELSLDSYLVPFVLLINIGIAILFNLGSNIIIGEISYITKALVAVLQLGVTTDFSIFLYHSYESKKDKYKTKDEAMSEAIKETFTSVTGSSLTTIAGFLVLCSMKLTLGTDLGLVMAKGVLLGVISVLTIFPSLLLVFDKLIEKTKHKNIFPKFKNLNNFIVKYHKIIFTIFIILLVPAYLANTKTAVYYKLDKSLPENLDSIVANDELKEKFNIVSPEIILIDKDIKASDINEMISDIEKLDGVDFVLSFSKLADMGLSSNMLSDEVKSIFESDKYQMILLNSTYDIATDDLNEQVNIIDNIIKKYDENSILAGEGPLMKDLVTISDTDFSNVNTFSIVCILIIMVIVLKSISLPILLILTIEFAIFLNMAIPYFTDVTLPFVAPIVLGTIQLGATIDYAILMTTTYLNNRKCGFDKKDSIKNTLDSCVTSIVVSGLCFFGATFGVGVYSKLEMISSLCTLISRGAIISMLVVIMVLPSILLIFDKLIIKTTLGFRKDRNMKKGLKKCAAMLLVISLFLPNMQVLALTKDETIYTKLNSDGSVKSMLIGEHLINTNKLDEIKDYSNLKDILNINGKETFIQNKNELTWNSKGKDIFYQGTLEKETPVTLNIKYYLDGRETKIDDMIGKEGNVTIKFKYNNRDRHYINGLNMYTPFVVTMGTIIDNENNSNIKVVNGKVLNNGGKSIVVGMATPGLYESLNVASLKGMDEVTISYNTTKFELSSIYSVITPKIIDSEDLKVFDKLNTLYSSMDTLKESIDKIEEGSKKLNDGALKLSDGSNQIYEALNYILGKLEELENGSISVDEGLKAILNKLEASGLLVDNDNNGSSDTLEYLTSQNNLVISKLKTTNETLVSVYNTFNLGNFSYQDILGLTSEVYANLGLNLTPEEVIVKNNELLNVKVSYESSYEINTNLIMLLENNNNVVGALNNLIPALRKLQAGTSTITGGINKLKAGVQMLSDNTYSLVNGTSDLYNGTIELSKGINTFNKDGISVLNNLVNNTLRNTEYKVRTLVKLGEDYNTFTMKADDTEGLTKFVLVVDGIKDKTVEKRVVKTEEKTSLWTKIKNLFK